MLVSAYRNGPLRNGLRKGYVVAADRPAPIVQAVTGDAALAAALERHRMSVRTDERRPAALWIDTGPVWLTTQQARRTVLEALADATAALAATVGQHGGSLVPSGVRGPWMDRWSWLCEDRHSVEVVNERQREVCSNLFRRWVPELIALTGRAAFGGYHADPHGSRRLADASDQVPARYIASASPMHLERVRQALRRDEGVSRLDVMDVNPLGDESTRMSTVGIRCIDAQVFPATALGHAVLLQALAMQGRQREKEGRRIAAVPQPMLDRNRSRAVASGLTARLEVEPDSRDSGPPEVKIRVAADSVLTLIRELLPHFRMLEVSAAELLPLVGGISLHDYYPEAVRSENDLFANWHREHDGALDTTALLGNAGVLARDQLTAANMRVTVGGTAVVEEYWSDLLRRRQQSRGDKGLGDNDHGEQTDGRRPATGRALAESTLMAALAEADSQAAAVAIVRRHVAAGRRLDLAAALKRVDRDDARQIRRLLRPSGEAVLRLRNRTDITGKFGTAIMEAVSRDGNAFIALDLPAGDKAGGLAAVDELRRSLPRGVATVLVTNSVFPRQADRRVSLEALVLDTRGYA